LPSLVGAGGRGKEEKGSFPASRSPVRKRKEEKSPLPNWIEDKGGRDEVPSVFEQNVVIKRKEGKRPGGRGETRFPPPAAPQKKKKRGGEKKRSFRCLPSPATERQSGRGLFWGKKKKEGEKKKTRILFLLSPGKKRKKKKFAVSFPRKIQE